MLGFSMCLLVKPAEIKGITDNSFLSTLHTTPIITMFSESFDSLIDRPAQCLCIQLSGISVVYDDDVMMFVQETVKDCLCLLGYCTLKPCFFTCPAESLTLVIFFGKQYKYLKLILMKSHGAKLYIRNCSLHVNC